MAALDFPLNPTNGQTFTSGGVSYYYNSAIGSWLTSYVATPMSQSSDTQIMYNDAGTANGHNGMVFSKSANTVTFNTVSAGSYVGTGRDVMNAAFTKANTALQNTTGTFAGTLALTGTATIGGGNATIQGSVNPWLGLIDGTNGTSYLQVASGITNLYAGGTQPLTFSTSGSTRAYIDAAGNFGIGKTPTYALDVLGSTIRIIGEAGGERIMTNSYANNAAGGVMSMYKGRGTIANPMGVQSGDYAGIIRGYAADTTGVMRETHRIGFYTGAANGVDDIGGNMRFYVKPAGAGGSIYLGLFIADTGYVGVGNVTNPAAPLDVAGGIKGAVTSMTAQATTSGTSKDFTGIPSWVKRITIVMNTISTNGTSALLVQIGSGSFLTSGYVSHIGAINGGTGQGKFTNGFGVDNGRGSAAVLSTGILVLYNISGNIWVGNGNTYYTNNDGAMNMFAGTVTLGGVLDRVRLTTNNGTDVFDLGSVNVFYEG